MPGVSEHTVVDGAGEAGGAAGMVVLGTAGLPPGVPLIPMGVLVGEIAEVTSERWAAESLAWDLADGGAAGIAVWLTRRWDVSQRRGIRRRRLCWWYEPEYWDSFANRFDPETLETAWKALRWHVRMTCQQKRMAWRDVVDIAPRLPLDPVGKPEDAALVVQLGAAAWEADSGVGGLYFGRAAAPPGRGRRAWHWPLRVGFLDDDRSRELRGLYHAIAASHGWPGTLTRVVEVERSGLSCDLLISPLDAEATAAAMTQARIGASAVVMLEAAGPATAAATSALLRKEAGVSAAAFVDAVDEATFLRELVREISHDQYFDAAVLAASRASGAWGLPLVFGAAGFIDRTRIRDRAEGMAVMAEANGRREAAAAMRMATAKMFDAESAAATDVVDAAESEEPRKPVPRYLNAEVYRDGTPAATVAPEGWSRVAAWLGTAPRRAGDRVAPFPDQEIAWDGGPVTLTVALTAPGFDVTADGADPATTSEAATVEITARPRGESDRGWFAIRPREGTTRLRARIAVLHANRVLQTAILSGKVRKTAAGGATTIRLETEGVIRADLQDLDERRAFDLALLTNHGLTDTPQITGYDGMKVTIHDFPDISAARERIGQRLWEVHDNPAGFGDYAGPAVTEVLKLLADEGVLIRRAMARAGLAEAIEKDPQRIQLVLAKSDDDRLPVEFIYDGPTPKDDAERCPHEAAALEAGDCGDCPNRASRAHVCAVRFWGVRKVIERQLYSVPGAAPPPGPTHERRIGPPAARLFARSNRAANFDGGEAAIAGLTGRFGVATAAGWDEWCAQVDALKPELLLLFPHTDVDQHNREVLEIGGQTRRPAEIDEEVVGEKVPVLAVLLGCDTAAGATSYASFVTAFQNAQASVVVGTLTPVLGRHVVPAAEALLETLEDLWAQPAGGATVADAMTRMRRKLLLRGLPVGLAVVAVGDADWLVGA